jgi:hypothetical protein
MVEGIGEDRGNRVAGIVDDARVALEEHSRVAHESECDRTGHANCSSSSFSAVWVALTDTLAFAEKHPSVR